MEMSNLGQKQREWCMREGEPCKCCVLKVQKQNFGTFRKDENVFSSLIAAESVRKMRTEN